LRDFGYLPDDPEEVAWRREHERLERERDKLSARLDAPQTKVFDAVRYEGPTGITQKRQVPAPLAELATFWRAGRRTPHSMATAGNEYVFCAELGGYLTRRIPETIGDSGETSLQIGNSVAVSSSVGNEQTRVSNTVPEAFLRGFSGTLNKSSWALDTDLIVDAFKRECPVQSPLFKIALALRIKYTS
jgi:hypothetical protein